MKTNNKAYLRTHQHEKKHVITFNCFLKSIIFCFTILKYTPRNITYKGSKYKPLPIMNAYYFTKNIEIDIWLALLSLITIN